jgi:predicted chitinase
MSYIDTLKPEQKTNLDLVIEGLTNSGISNPYTKAGILAIVSKESGFLTKEESGYYTTSNDRIRAIFGKRVSDLTDVQLNALKKDNYKFFEKVYGVGSGAPLGNKQEGDGFKFRGRGFNQLTGRGNYEFYAKQTGIAIDQKPELLNNPLIAAKVLGSYFRVTSASRGNQLSAYNAENINDFKNLNDAVTAIYHANAGWGKSKQQIEADQTGGLRKARQNAPDLLAYIGGEKKNYLKLVLAVLLLIALFLYVKR